MDQNKTTSMNTPLVSNLKEIKLPLYENQSYTTKSNCRRYDNIKWHSKCIRKVNMVIVFILCIMSYSEGVKGQQVND